MYFANNISNPLKDHIHYNSHLNDTKKNNFEITNVCPRVAGYLYDLLITYYVPFLIFIGIIGNILLCLVLMTASKLKRRSSSYYLAALAVTDCSYLLVLFVVYCSYSEIFHLFEIEGFCQVFIYVSSVCAFLNVWLIVAFTTERFIAVKYVFLRKYICTTRRAKKATAIIIGVAMVSQLHILWIAGVRIEGDRRGCDILSHYLWLGNVMNFLDTFVTLLIPATLIIVMNTCIACEVFKSKKFFRRRTVERERVFNSLRIHLTQKLSDSSEVSATIQHNINKKLLLVSSVFLLLNFPSYTLRIIIYFGYEIAEKRAPDYLCCCQQFVMLMYYTHFCANFLLYSLNGRTFRAALWQLLCGCKRRNEEEF